MVQQLHRTEKTFVLICCYRAKQGPVMQEREETRDALLQLSKGCPSSSKVVNMVVPLFGYSSGYQVVVLAKGAE